MVLINEIPTEVGHGSDEIICLRKENAALKADAERYRWLRENECADVRIQYVGKRSGVTLDFAIDAAIDNAMQKENGK